jgi:octaprenyl-diphosphate synthase
MARRRCSARSRNSVGTAYQLVDDVLDYRSDPALRGKNIGDDLAEGKPTLPLIHALKHGSESQQAAIRQAIERGGIEQLDTIVAAIDATGGLDYAARLARTETDKALVALGALPETPYKEGLASLARFAVEHTT